MTATASHTVTLQDLDGTYVLDPSHSRMGFVARHAMVTKVRGSFNEFSGSATTGAGLADARIEVAITADSITTGNADRDGHLRSGDFFGTDEHAELTFVSSSVEAKDAETLRVAGDLTIHGVTRPVLFDVTINSTAPHPMRKTAAAGFDASTTIKRSEFGVGGMIPAVADEVKLNISMEAGEPKKDAPEAKKAG
jgi:polyisoprenoid-binding protein YceI